MAVVELVTENSTSDATHPLHLPRADDISEHLGNTLLITLGAVSGLAMVLGVLYLYIFHIRVTQRSCIKGLCDDRAERVRTTSSSSTGGGEGKSRTVRTKVSVY